MADVEDFETSPPETTEELAQHVEQSKENNEEIFGGDTPFTTSVEDIETKEEEVTDAPTASGIEEVNFTDMDSAEAIEDGFPVQAKTQVNGLPSSVAPLSKDEEGFEDLPVSEDNSVEEKKDETLKSPLALWIMKQNVHPQVVNLIYWVELQRTTGVFGGILLLLISLQFYPLIVVATTFALSMLVVAFLYRIGMTIVKAVQKTSAEHPFKHLLEEKIEISEDNMQKWASRLRSCINNGIRVAQCLFLVKDTAASLKAMIICWLVSYIAICINVLTLSIMGTVAVFTLPKLYEEKQKEADKVIALIMEKSCVACKMIEQKLPEKVKLYFKKDKKD